MTFGTLRRLAFGLALASQLALAGGCRESGGVSAPKSASNTGAASVDVGVSLGSVLYGLVHAQLEQSADNPQGRLAALEARRSEFIAAVDAMVPAHVTGNLRSTLQDIVDLVHDGTLPDTAEHLARILELLAHDPADPQDHRLQALVTLAGGRAPLDRESLLRLLGRMFAYPEVDELLSGIAAVVRENDGLDGSGQPAPQERDLVTDLVRVGAELLRGLERPQNAQAVNAGWERLLALLLSPIDLRGTQVGGPAWAVRLDERGNPKVLPKADGTLPAPFVDQDGDHKPDVNAEGLPVDANGDVIELPPFGKRGARDAAGRALSGTGAPVYEYLDAKRTPLGQAARMAGELTAADVPFALVKALDTLAPRIGRTDATGRAYQAYSDQNPLLDLAWAGLELFRYRDAPKLLDAFAALIDHDPDKAERLLVKVVEAVDILRTTPAAPSGATGAQGSMLDDLQPLLDQAFEVNSQTGQSAARLMLLTFSAEQARLRNLPLGFARMMRYSDWARRIPTQPGQVSMFERLLDMMAEADQCDSWPFGNMAMFYLEAMVGQKSILGINISVNTIHLILDIGLLRSLLCNRISADNVRALSAFAQSGALDALIPIADAFYRAGELETLKDTFLSLQGSYAASVRPYEPALIRVLESGSVELLFEVLDDMNQVQVPGTQEAVSLRIADFLEAMVDDERSVSDRRGQPQTTLLHMLLGPLDTIMQRAGGDPDLERALDQAFQIVLATVTDDAGTPSDPSDDFKVLKNHGLIPLSAAALEAAAEGMSIYPWVRNADITDYQQVLTDAFTSEALPVLVDAVLAIERSSESGRIKAAIANVLQPNPQAAHDIYGSVLQVGAALLQTQADPAALVDLLRFAGRALDPARGHAGPIIHALVRLIDGPGGPTVIEIIRGALDRGPSGDLEPPIETVIAIFEEVGEHSLASPAPTTVDSVRQAALDLVEFIRDDEHGLGLVWRNLLGGR